MQYVILSDEKNMLLLIVRFFDDLKYGMIIERRIMMMDKMVRIFVG